MIRGQYYVALLVVLGVAALLTGCQRLREEPPAARAPEVQVTVVPEGQGLSYRERRDQGLLTPEELRGELAMQEVEGDIEAGRVETRARSKSEVPTQYVTPTRQYGAGQQGRWVGKYQVEHMPGETSAEYEQRCHDVEVLQDPRLPALVEQKLRRYRGW